MLQLRTQYLPGLRQNLIYRKTIDHSSNCGNISRYICLICFGQKKNTVEAYFTNSSLQSRNSFPGIQGKLEHPKVILSLNLTLLIDIRQCEQWTSINNLTHDAHTIYSNKPYLILDQFLLRNKKLNDNDLCAKLCS